MVDLVVPVSAPGASAGATELDRFAGAARGVAVAGDRVGKQGTIIAGAFRAKAAAASEAGRSFGSMGREIGHVTGHLATLTGLLPGVGRELSGLGFLAGTLGPVGVAIGVIAASLHLVSANAAEAKEKLEAIASTKKALAAAQKERGSLLDATAGIAGGASKDIGQQAKELIRLGGDPRQSTRLIDANTSAKQAIELDSLLAKTKLSESEKKSIVADSALLAASGFDRVKSAQSLADQFASDKLRDVSMSGMFNGGQGNRTASRGDRLLDAVGLDSDSIEGKQLLKNMHSGIGGRLDEQQALEVKKQKDLIGSAFSGKGAEAVAEAAMNFKPALEENSSHLKELDKTIQDLTTELKNLQKKRSGWTFNP